jgi:GT2 family glycosyltransferase
MPIRRSSFEREQGGRMASHDDKAEPVREVLSALADVRKVLDQHSELLSSVNHRSVLLEHLYDRAVRDTGRGLAGSSAWEGPVPDSTSFVMPNPVLPEATVVIPVHDQLSLTLRCLESLARARTAVAFDVLVVDDASAAPLPSELARVRGLRVERLQRNVGFLQACNAGVACARGRFVVFLNNDTIVHDCWLDALVERAMTDHRIALVGAMLLCPDGTVQEAGSIVFRDGSARHYGRGSDPSAFDVGVTRDVDYCSAACLLVRRTFWDEVGGFDARYQPAYYEDVDLAFEARSRGWRVVYEPAARVVHLEGGSHGTDLAVGTKAFQVRNQMTFARKWSHILEAQHSPDTDRPLRARDRRGGHVIVVDHYVPEHDRDSGSLRMRYLLELLVEEGFVVHFISDNLHASQPYTRQLQALGIEVIAGAVDPYEVIRQLAPDVVLALLARPGVAWRYIPWVREHCPDVPIVFDMVDAHGLRERRRAMVESSPGTAAAADAWDRMEATLALCSDLTLAVSSADADHLRRCAGDVPYAVLPNIHRPRTVLKSVSERDGILFVGGFRHPPNVRAAIDLVREIVPRVERLLGRDVPVILAGSDPPEEVRRLASRTVTVAGWVLDLAPLHDHCRVFVAPLSFGAGMKGKIGESLINGLPVVTTSIGAEGLDLTLGVDLLVADRPGDLAHHVAAVLTDDDLWRRLAESGRRYAEENLGIAAGRWRLRSILDGLGVARPGVPPRSGRAEPYGAVTKTATANGALSDLDRPGAMLQPSLRPEMSEPKTASTLHGSDSRQ